MRFLFVVALLAVAGCVGWLVGSLHPAPSAVLEPIKQMMSRAGAATSSPAASRSAESGASSVVDDATLSQYRAWIGEARAEHPYPESEERMYAVMMCESRGQADAVNPAGPYSGLFQYSAATWNGDWNTYRDRTILDARAQVFATALAWANGMQSQWGCYAKTN